MVLASKKTPYDPQGDRPDVRDERAKFVRNQLKLPPSRLVFLDESGCHPGIGPRRGWSLRGKPLFGPEQVYARGRHVSMIAAMSLAGIQALMTVRGGVKTPSFRAFVFNRWIPKLHPGDIVLWDNLNLHKREEFRRAIKAVGAKLVQLPRYSPDLNPIEPAWGKVKAWIRKNQPKTVAQLRELMRRALYRIRPSEARGWFKYCGYRLPAL